MVSDLFYNISVIWAKQLDDDVATSAHDTNAVLR